MADGSSAATANSEAPPRGRTAAFGALALLIVAATLTPITNNDLFLHLETGERILATGQVPVVDDYSALARGRPFIAHEWLAGVLFRLVEQAFGVHGVDALILFQCGVALLVAFVLHRAAMAMGALPSISIPCLAFVMLLAAARFLERPHIFGYLLTALFLLLLARRRQRLLAGARPTWVQFILMPLLQVLWANLHGSFLLGPGIVGLAAAGALFDGLLARFAGRPVRFAAGREAIRLAGLAVLLGACCLLNPYGAELLRFPFMLTGSGFMEQIYEWLPPFSSVFSTTYMVRYYIVWATAGAAALVAALWRARRGDAASPGTFPALLFATLFFLSLRMNRNVTDFALATMPGVATALTSILAPHGRLRGAPRMQRALLPGSAVLMALLALWFILSGYPYGPSSRRVFGLGLGRGIPVAATDYLERHGIVGATFNTYASGAYLIRRLYPGVRVGMDSRNDVYGEELYAAHLRALADPEALREMLWRLSATFIFLEWPQPGMSTTALAIRNMENGWRPVYFDDAAVVYLDLDGPYAELARRDAYDILDPPLFRPGTWSPDEAVAALRETDRAVEAPGGAYMGRVMRIEALLTLGRTGEARVLEERIVAEDPPLHHIQTLLGLAHLARGDRDAAVPRLRRALELNPASTVAAQALATVTSRR